MHEPFRSRIMREGNQWDVGGERDEDLQGGFRFLPWETEDMVIVLHRYR